MNFEIDPETKDWIDDGEGGFVEATDARNDVYTQLAQAQGWWGDDTGLEKMPRVTEADVQRIEDGYMRALQRLIDDGLILDRVEFERATERDRLFQRITVYDARTGQALDVTQLQALQFRTNRIQPAPAAPVVPPVATVLDFSGTSAPAEVDTYSRGSVSAPRTAIGAGGDEVIKFLSGVYAYAWSETLARIGASVPPAATNLEQDSESFGSVGSATITNNDDVAPDGTTTAARVQSSTSIFGARCTGATVVSGQTYTASAYMKSKDGSPQTVDFNSAASGASPDFTVGADWDRYTFTFVAGSTSARMDVRANGDFLLWGMQVEEGSEATEYIPTSGGIAARAATQIDFTLDGVPGVISNTGGTPEVSSGFAITESDGNIVTQVEAA